MDFALKKLKKILLALSIVMVALIFSPTTFSYWVDITNVSSQNNATLPIGRWDEGKKLFVNNNLSSSFSNYHVLIDFGEPFRQEKYDNLPQSPTPKTHSGVLQSDYVFDGWYFDNGTKLSAGTILQGDETIYPSWNSTNNWTYSTSGSMYNLTKKSGVVFSGDLYVPGWRYKGRIINSLSAMSTLSAPLEVNGLWIGEGIKAITNTAFRYSSVSSLVLEEGLETIGNDAFRNISNTGSSLILPDSLKTISQHSFRDMTYSGTLDINPNSNLETIATYAFNNSGITGSLSLPSTLISIGSYAFQSNNFNGTLDISPDSNLETIETYAFTNAGFTGSLYLPSTLKTMENSAFRNNNFNGTLDMSNVTQLTQINQFAFSGNKFVGDLKLTGEIGSIGHSAFTGNLFDGNLDLSEAKKLTEIKQYAFQNNNFASVDFALDGVLNYISSQSFQNNKIQELRFPRSLTTVEGVVFSGNPLKTIYVPLGLASMGSSGGLGNVTIYFEEPSQPAGWAANWFTASYKNIISYGQILPY